MASPQQDVFSFVAYGGPKVRLNPNIRRLIRRQAMKNASAERKRTQSYGQHNLGQFPEFLDSSSCANGEGDPVSTICLPQSTSSSLVGDRTSPRKDEPSESNTEQQQNQPAIVSSFHPYTYPIPRMHPEFLVAERFSILLHLTQLTGLRLGIAQPAHSKSEPGSSGKSLHTPQHGSHKMLCFISSRYGQMTALSHATDCVVAKIQHMMQIPDCRSTAAGEAIVLLHYTKALRALQAALNDEKQRTTAETLCATELLGVFEQLNGSPEANSWIRHAGGAAQLIKARGTHRFQTELEMALFTAHIGPSVMDAFLNNKSCFLAEENWRKVMCSAIRSDESFAEQRDLVLVLWGHLVNGPRVFKEVTDLVLSPNSPPQNVIDNQIQKILKDRNNLLRWEKYAQRQPGSQSIDLNIFNRDTICTWSAFKIDPRNSQHIIQLALWGTYVLCRILKGRLLVALSPSRFHYIETECQDLAGKIVGLRHFSTMSESDWLLDSQFVSQSIWIAKGVVETEKIWCGIQESGVAMIEKWKFKSWCRAIGRTSHPFE